MALARGEAAARSFEPQLIQSVATLANSLRACAMERAEAQAAAAAASQHENQRAEAHARRMGAVAPHRTAAQAAALAIGGPTLDAHEAALSGVSAIAEAGAPGPDLFTLEPLPAGRYLLRSRRARLAGGGPSGDRLYVAGAVQGTGGPGEMVPVLASEAMACASPVAVHTAEPAGRQCARGGGTATEAALAAGARMVALHAGMTPRLHAGGSYAVVVINGDRMHAAEDGVLSLGAPRRREDAHFLLLSLSPQECSALAAEEAEAAHLAGVPQARAPADGARTEDAPSLVRLLHPPSGKILHVDHQTSHLHLAHGAGRPAALGASLDDGSVFELCPQRRPTADHRAFQLWHGTRAESAPLRRIEGTRKGPVRGKSAQPAMRARVPGCGLAVAVAAVPGGPDRSEAETIGLVGDAVASETSDEPTRSACAIDSRRAAEAAPSWCNSAERVLYARPWTQHSTVDGQRGVDPSLGSPAAAARRRPLTASHSVASCRRGPHGASPGASARPLQTDGLFGPSQPHGDALSSRGLGARPPGLAPPPIANLSRTVDGEKVAEAMGGGTLRRYGAPTFDLQAMQTATQMRRSASAGLFRSPTARSTQPSHTPAGLPGAGMRPSQVDAPRKSGAVQPAGSTATGASAGSCQPASWAAVDAAKKGADHACTRHRPASAATTHSRWALKPVRDAARASPVVASGNPRSAARALSVLDTDATQYDSGASRREFDNAQLSPGQRLDVDYSKVKDEMAELVASWATKRTGKLRHAL